MLRHYLHGGGNDLTLNGTDMDRIWDNPGFNEVYEDELARVIRANGEGDIDHKGTFINHNLDPSQGDLFSAFHDIRWKINVKGCTVSEQENWFFEGDVTLSVEDRYGFSDPRMAHRTPFFRQEWLHDRYQFMQEGRFLRLERRGWVHPFNVKGSKTRSMAALVPKTGGAPRVEIAPIDTY
ncbi:hypothetical protein JIN85_04665 [Luteolibacter pohnpeiensis]|uniref:Uncharacterized protein n=1 Tax=Luteolibacter pohnpeiensis TaxID=454153 RepID=A0A934VVD8_9BACT|nr:hypothetical protein [Luteolibacter pohnpeiensis]MBK1881693.1 hypothetical protein [Luteolibacter pohnpeiensis]